MFHRQAIDSYGFLSFGTFFANPPRGLVAASSRPPPDPACTDLSTVDVDKDENAFATATCVIFVTNLGASAVQLIDAIAGRGMDLRRAVASRGTLARLHRCPMRCPHRPTRAPRPTRSG